jgi:3-oxoacyl-(acyl-carrier-protein) synthase
MTARIVITGMGIISPYGVGLQIFWEKLMAGCSGIRKLTNFDTSHIRCTAGGQLSDFDITAYLPNRLIRRVDRFSAFGLVAAQQAMEDAGLTISSLASSPPEEAPELIRQAEGRDRVGITVGTNLGGWEFAERELYHLWTKGPRAVSPYQAIAWFPTAVQGNISIQLGIKGVGRTFLCDRAGGAYAIMHAAHCLRVGHADKMFAGGAEAPFSPYAALCYETSGLMSKQASERPTTAYRPFDRDHDGLVAAEGSAFLMLERADDAQRRGARIYAEVAGWAATHDGYDPVQPAPDGQRYADAMTLAMRRAGVTVDQIDGIFAAGSAVPAEDLSETRAIRLALGDQADRIPVSAPKSAFGNLFGAATPADVVIALMAMQHHRMPATLHLDQKAAGCDLDYVACNPRPIDQLDVVAVNARGIGGANACLILRRWPTDSRLDR